MNRSLGNQVNWQPQVALTMPSFKTGASVSIKLYIRWLVQLNVNIYDMVKISPSVTSRTVVGIDSSFSFTAANCCPPNTLRVNTFLSTSNSVAFGDGTGRTLYSGQAGNANQCFAVPALVPSPDEIESLKAVGAAYCTSHIKYVPPATVSSSTVTTTVPGTTTSLVTSTVTNTVTINTISTWSFDSYSVTTLSATTATVTATNKTPNFSYLNWMRDIAGPTPAAAPGLDKRQAAQPAMLAGWDATKISYACKQVATGTTTISVTTTATATSGVVTATSTVTVNKNGPLVTSTMTISYTRFLGQKTATAAGTSTKTVRPTPQATTCFKLKIHGPWWVEGAHMRYTDYGGFQPDVTTWPYDTFYLSSKGHLMGYSPAGKTFFLGRSSTTYTNGNWDEVSFYEMAQAASFQYATCWKDADPCTKGFQCKFTDASGVDRVGMSLMTPGYGLYKPPTYSANGYSTNQFRPSWGLVTVQLPANVYIPFTTEYEDAPCPCY